MADEARGRRGLLLAEGRDDLEAPPTIGRRDLVKLLGASMALAGVGCAREPPQQIMPYTRTPPEIRPGIPVYYATSMELDGFATGLLVKSHEGRPTKIEGNPAHPASLGATSVYEQAAILGLYDRERARAIRHRGDPATWNRLVRTFAGARLDGGAGLRFLLEPTGSPLLGDLIELVRKRLPAARFTFYSTLRPGYEIEGARLAFGAPLSPQHDFSEAAVILSLEADFLSSMPFSVRYARQFAERRRVSGPSDPMSRLYMVESMVSPTGSIADHRLRTRPSEVGRLSASVAAELVLGLGLLPNGAPAQLRDALAPLRAGADARVIQALVRDLARNAGTSVVIAGERQPPNVHAVAHLINALLGNPRAATAIPDTRITGGPSGQDLASLADEIQRGQVDTLVMLEGNPSYNAPTDLDFPALLRRVPNTVYLGLHENETAAASAWFVPAAHFLESWGDARAYDGTTSLIQPLITPLFGGRTRADLLAIFTGDGTPDAHARLRASWSARIGGAGFERFWRESLRSGVCAGTTAIATTPAIRWEGIFRALGELAAAPRPESGSLELGFLGDASVYDGRFANNPWLQELPDPITKLTWDNAAMLSPATAARLGVATEDMLLIDLHGRKVEIPAFIVGGHADEVLSLPLGYGRKGSEVLARFAGFNVYPLRTSAAPFFAGGAAVHKLPDARYPLAVTQIDRSGEGRPIALSTTLPSFRADPAFTEELRGPVSSLFAPYPMEGDQWAMTIDMSICTGCSACVIACQAENNIQVVGKEGVRRGREMHWLRIDTYSSGPPEAPSVIHQPMLCQHCEKAPCEYVCPVNATVHSPDGLNEMVYNRCVGTRFCSNNCPYKVRRFNWFDWYEREPANQGLVKLQRNPDVTVRERGVMEKCTYCVQRIRGTEIRAQLERRPIREGEVRTACQEACPTRAIQFDSLRNEGSKMAQWRREPRSFEVLHDLGTAPRTRYLADLKNPNPEIE